MGRYRLTNKADEDLTNLYRYGIEAYGAFVADRYFDTVIGRLDDIAADPLRFQSTDYRVGYRRCVHPPYTICFRIIGTELVEIVRVLRGQDPGTAF